MAHYTLPYHAQMPEQQQYLMATGHYHDNRMTAVAAAATMPELGAGGGGWMEQTEGGGKFQLKRRRRCGQCGPCQVKDNCNKCQYCLRKDILKQACVLRKCVYLRKPQSHSRPDITNGGGGGKTNSGGGGGGGGGGGKEVEGVGNGRSSSCSSSTNQDSPHKPASASTPSAMPTPTPPAPKPVPVNPSAVAAAAAVVHSAELSSCQVAKTAFPMTGGNKGGGGGDPARPGGGVAANSGHGDPLRAGNEGMAAAGNAVRAVGFPPAPNNKGMAEPVRSNGLTGVNKAVCDPLRASALEQHHSAMLTAAGALESCRMSYMTDATRMDSVRGPAQVLGPGTSGTNGAFGMGGNTIPASPACSMAKDFPLAQREQFHAPADQWGTVPYGYSHHPASWAPAPPQVSYGIPTGGSYYPGSLGSACQLGMTSPAASHFPAPSQPSFHRAVPFPHPDFSSHANFHASASAAVQSTMTPPFYPPPMQIPSTLPNFPSFNQLPSSAGPHSSYTAARPPVYPASFYSSFRPSYEPQIYHVQASAPSCPFSRPHMPLPESASVSGEGLSGGGAESDSSREVDGESDRRIRWDNDGRDGRLEDGEGSVVTPLSVSSVTCYHKFLPDRSLSPSSLSPSSLSPSSLSPSSLSPSSLSPSNSCTGKPTGRDTSTQKDRVTDSTPMTKAGDCGKKRVAERDTYSGIDEDLSQLLKRLSGRRHCDSGICDALNSFTSLRSDESFDRDTADKNDAMLKMEGCPSLTGADEHVEKCSRKRRYNRKKTEGCFRKIRRSGSSIFQTEKHEKCHCESDGLHSFDQDVLRCKKLPSFAAGPACIHEQQQHVKSGSPRLCCHTRSRDLSYDSRPGDVSHQDALKLTSHRETLLDVSHYSPKTTAHGDGLRDIAHEYTSKDTSKDTVFKDTSHDTLGDTSPHDTSHDMSHDTSGYLTCQDTLSYASHKDTSREMDMPHDASRLQVINMNCADLTSPDSRTAGNNGAMAVNSNVASSSPREEEKVCHGGTDTNSDDDSEVCVQTEQGEQEEYRDSTYPFSQSGNLWPVWEPTGDSESVFDSVEDPELDAESRKVHLDTKWIIH